MTEQELLKHKASLILSYHTLRDALSPEGRAMANVVFEEIVKVQKRIDALTKAEVPSTST